MINVIHLFRLILQRECRLPFTRYSLHVDWLYHMLWKLCKYSWWMWLLRWCWWSRVTTIVYNGFNRAWTIYCYWHILQRFGGHNGWTTNLAAALSYTCEKDANKSECGHLPSYLFEYASVSFLWRSKSPAPANKKVLPCILAHSFTWTFLRELAPVRKWLISNKNKEKGTGSTNLICEPWLYSQTYHEVIEFLSIEVIGQLKYIKKSSSR